MSNRIRLALAASLALTAVYAVAVASPASAEDQRPCVSNVEWRHLDTSGAPANRPTPREVQRQWDVIGLEQSVVLTWGDSAWPGIGFPRCGYSMDEGWYGYSLDEKGRVVTKLGYLAEGATLHGHP